MSKTLLLTAYDSTMAPIGDLTSPLMLGYANRHGFDFKCMRLDGTIPHSYWAKIFEVHRSLSPLTLYGRYYSCYDRVIWLDADQVITNPDFVPPWETGFQASFDWGNDATDESKFSACAFVIGKDMLPFIEAVAASYETFKDKPFPEQAAMRHQYVNGDSFKYRMRTHTRRTFNAVPKEICEEAPEPWQPGDWCAHLTHVEVSKRAELFHVIREQAQ